MRRFLPVLAGLLLVGCGQGGLGAGPGLTPVAEGASGGADLRFRPVLQVVASDATSSANGIQDARYVRQSDTPATQQAALDRLDCRAEDPLRGEDEAGLPLVTCSADGTIKYLLGPAVLSGAEVERAGVGRAYGATVITLELTAVGSAAWADFTEAHIGRQVAAVWRTTVLSAPTVYSTITSGNTQIIDSFSRDEARRIVQRITGPAE
ncbi:precorrin-3B C(17)-methyltransferase [Pseudonocardiaceae bacterium YIM PH 21723]|nr:precorrin-3B C(17)-methyltransferase [Pseudonocardiaceae bacterium YIM PH 21723]